jgi:hypothetical protein
MSSSKPPRIARERCLRVLAALTVAGALVPSADVQAVAEPSRAVRPAPRPAVPEWAPVQAPSGGSSRLFDPWAA